MKKLLFLFILISVCFSLIASEAEQFFSEAKRLYRQDRTTAWGKLNTAIALEPKNLIFRSRKLDWQYRELPYKASLSDYLEILEKMYKLDIVMPRSMESIRWKLRLGKIEEAWNKASKKDQKKLAAFCDKFRVTITKEYEIKLKMNKPSRSLRDLENKDELFFCRMREFAHYYDMDKYKADVLAGALEYLRRTDRFFRNPPKGIKYSLPPEKWIRFHLSFNWCTQRDWMYRGMKYSPDELEEYINIAKEHPLKFVRGMGLLLELYNKTIRNNYNPKIFEKDVHTFVLAFAKLKLIPQKPYDHIKSRFWDKRLRKHPKLITIADKIGKKIIPLWCKTPGELFVDEILAIKDRNKVPAFVLANKEKCLKFAPALRKFSAGGNWYTHFPRVLQGLIWRYKVPKGKEALAIFNHQMKIEQVFVAPEINNRDSVCNDGILNGKKLLLAVTNHSDTIRIYDLDTVSMKYRELYDYKTKYNMPCRTFRNIYSNSFPLDCDGELLVAGANDAIHVFRLDGSKAWTITDLPEANVNAIALLDKRIYVWGGIKSYGRSNGKILFSCNLEGNDRKIYFNSKTKKYDKKFPSNMRGLFADRKRNALLLLNYNKLYRFYPNEYRWEMLLDFYELGAFSNNTNQTSAQRFNDDKLYISVSSDCIIYDTKTKQSEWYYSTTKRSKGKVKFCNYGTNFSSGPFCPQGKYLWRLGHGSGNHCYETVNGKANELFFYPPFEEKSRLAIARLFPCPDGKSALLIRGSDILKLTPRENVK